MPEKNDKSQQILEEMVDDQEFRDKIYHIRAFEQLHELDIREVIKNSKGPFTYQGGYINYHEWHAFLLGAGLIDFAFRWDQGAFLFFYLFMGIVVTKHSFRNCQQPLNIVGELGKNLHYYIIAGVVTTVLWMQTGAAPPETTIGLVESTVALLS